MTDLLAAAPPPQTPLAASDPHARSGLEQMRAVISGSEPFNGIGRTLGFRPVEADEGRVVFAATPGLDVYNPLGAVHGGYAATLLDSACGCAVHTRLPAGRSYTTLEIKVAYHRPMTADTGEVRAEGVVLNLGRRIAYAEARLTDAAGRLLATATSTLMLL